MTVSTTDSVVEYVSGGPTFPIPYRFLQNSDIEAILVKQDGTSETLTGAQYTLVGAGTQNGGSLTSAYAASVLAAPGALLTISRIMDAVQPTDLRNQGKYLAETHENVFDRLTMLIQQGFAGLSRALTRPIGKDYFDAKGYRISNLANPEEGQDAVTRQWVGDYLDQVTGLVNTTNGISYDGDTLFNYLRFGLLRAVDNIAALRLLASFRNQRAVVLGYYAKGDYQPVSYYVDQADTTSADDGFSVIVANDGARWKICLPGYIDVRWAGAKADDATDSFAPIQRAITYAGAHGIGKIVVLGKYVITDTLVVDFASYFKGINIEGGSALIDQIRQTGANKDAFWWSTTQYLRNSSLKNLGIYCEVNAGHGVNIKLGATLNRFEDVNITVLNPTKSCYLGIWSGIALGQPQGVFDTTWEGGDLYITSAHTVFGIDFVTNGTTFNENNFRRMRWNNGNTLQFARFTNVDTATYLEGNTIDGVNFEICSGGGIFATNMKGWIIRTCKFWDQGGAYKNHLVHMGANSGLPSIGNTLETVMRNGDTMTAGKRDIFIESGNDTTLINCYTDPGNSPSYDFNGQRVLVIGPTLSGVVNGQRMAISNPLNAITASATFAGSTGTASYAYNVGIITRSATGLYRVTFTNPRTDINYRVYTQITSEVAAWAQVSKTASYFDIKVVRFDGAAVDMTEIDFDVFG